MKAYVTVTGIIFGLIAIAHVLRMIEEGAKLATSPWYLLITVAAAALSLWALRLLLRSKSRGTSVGACLIL